MSRSAAPLVSIGVPVYDGEPYLEQTLRSLLHQDERRLEIVISDNASTDATEQVCRRLAAQDPRVRYTRADENRGAAWNYNHVLELATAPWFKWAAADDLCRPTFVSACLEALTTASAGTVLAYPETVLIGPDDAALGPMDDRNLDLRDDTPAERLDRLLRNRLEWHPVFGVVRTDVLRETRGIGRFPLADAVVLAELCLRGRFVQVPEPLFLRRYHDQRSLVAAPTFVQQLAWYDPQRRARAAFPQSRVTRELLGAVSRAPLDPAERLRCAAVVLRRWTAPHWRHIGGEVKLAARDGLGRIPGQRRAPVHVADRDDAGAAR